MTLAPLHPQVSSRRPKRRRGVAAEFFAGIGLVRLALEQEGWRVAYANDIDPAKLEMYEANFGRRDFHLGDIHQLDAATLPTCDLFTASFPCNDLSIAGGRAGLDGKESSAFWGFIRLLRDLGDRRPPLVMLENVVGFLQSNGGRDLETALRTLNELGYAVDAVILNALHWTPQSRARLFIVAQRAMPFLPPSVLRGRAGEGACVEQATLRPAALAAFIQSHQNISWSLRDLPEPPPKRRRLSSILQDLPDDDPHWWSRERADYFFGQLSDRHRKLAETMIRGDRVRYATAFRRVRKGRSMAELRTDGVAGCLRTPRGGSGRQILFKAGHGKFAVRLLTARECARLQGVPDDYRLDHVGLNQALFGLGDAVCVPAVAWIARHYLKRLLDALAVEPDLFGGVA